MKKNQREEFKGPININHYKNKKFTKIPFSTKRPYESINFSNNNSVYNPYYKSKVPEFEPRTGQAYVNGDLLVGKMLSDTPAKILKGNLKIV